VTTTFLVLGDQLSTDVAPWPTLSTDTVILVIESDELIAQPRHRTRTALYLMAMRAFAERVRGLGFTVDYRRASSFTEGLACHRAAFTPTTVRMNQPRGRRATALFTRLGVELLPDPFFLTDAEEFRARKKRPATMEAFYREQRRRLGYLMDGDAPRGGQWNFDEQNREPLPKGGGTWPVPWSVALDANEQSVVDELLPSHPGNDAVAFWPRTREQALAQLADAVDRIIPSFGPHEDAASVDNWHLAHSRLSVALNMGLLHPREVVEAVVAAHEAGRIPLASAEGFVRQIIGWREWIWLWHQVRDTSYEASNYLAATGNLPATWASWGSHPMKCLDSTLAHLRDYGWTHHIERLMVLGNAATLAGINPAILARWMEVSFVDGAEWVMEANVIGMATYADGGQTATKPYVSGGNYLNKMTDFCRGCAFAPTERTGERACPLTTLYWSFLDTKREPLRRVHRMAPALRAAEKRPDLAAIGERASVAIALVRGE